MAVIGPFGSYLSMGFPVRLFFFTSTALVFWLQVLLYARLLRTFEPTSQWPVAARMAVAGLVASVPGTAAIMILVGWLVRPIPLSFVPEILAENAFLAMVVSVLVGLFIERRRHADADSERARLAATPTAPTEAAPATVAPAAPDFFRRVPPALGRDLLALEMEDHYLRIHTALGSDLILLRLRDALAELGPAHGRQVHRSWWVAEGAVTSVERDAGRPVLVLRNGLRVPVSKTYREQVKEAGWLAAAS
ncbi:MAG: LytTR family transcriptional regulator [Reyranella sp.]|nr:MAG: LytTR family transcriptional regulator [Reyranella sp.]